MIEPNDDNLIRLLMTALATATSNLCTNKSDIVSMMNRNMSCSVHMMELATNTDREINVTELRSILTGLINEYNDSLSTTQK